jgi:iron(III) transport system substrate-binding protein
LQQAGKEPVVNIYASLNLKDSVPITEVFEKKYGITVSLWPGLFLGGKSLKKEEE